MRTTKKGYPIGMNKKNRSGTMQMSCKEIGSNEKVYGRRYRIGQTLNLYVIGGLKVTIR